MNTRREFLRAAGVAPVIGVLDCGVLGSVLASQSVCEMVTEEAEPRYAGRSMGYWLERLD